MFAATVLPTTSAGNMSNLCFLLSFVVVNGAVIKLRRERPTEWTAPRRLWKMIKPRSRC